MPIVHHQILTGDLVASLYLIHLERAAMEMLLVPVQGCMEVSLLDFCSDICIRFWDLLPFVSIC